MAAEETRVEQARALFHGEEKLNCAQAIFKAYRSIFDVTDDDINAAKAFGGGRAEGGVCGALHAAKLLVAPSAYAAMEREFLQRAGSTRCRQIRKARKTSCRDCVGIVAELLEKETGPYR